MLFINSVIAKNPFSRAILIALMNVLFYSKTIKSWFEKNVFNPYEIDGNKHADYALMQLKNITSNINISGESILEIGPGGNYYLACLLLQNGAKKVFVIDNENHHFFSNQEIAIYKKLYPESISDTKTINQDKITVINYGRHETIPLSDNCVDIIYSNAVLEHVHDPKRLLEECQRILRVSGIMMHQIDYRDHIFSQKSLFFLKIPNIFFNFFFKNTGMWVNRIRHSQWINIFNSLSDLRLTKIEKQSCEKVTGKNKEMTKEDQQTTGALFLSEKYVK